MSSDGWEGDTGRRRELLSRVRVTLFFVVTAKFWANAFPNSAEKFNANGFRVVVVMLNEADLFSVAQ